MSRFGCVSEKDISAKINTGVPRNTQRTANWAKKIWTDWSNERNNARQMGQPIIPGIQQLKYITAGKFNELLCYFVLDIRKQDGDKYPPKTLYSIVAGIQRYVRFECGRAEFNFIDSSNNDFFRFRQVLDAEMKSLTAAITPNKRQAEPITQEQERVLWEKGLLGISSSLALSRTVYFYACKVFGLRSRGEHLNLDVEQFSFGEDDGGRFIRFQGKNSKNTSGGLSQRHIEMKNIKQYDISDNLYSVYKILYFYLSKIPPFGRFYRRPLESLFEGDIRFSLQAVGVNKLASYIPNMMQEAGFAGHFTSHSGKVTTATQLFREGIDEQLIMQRTGHR
ncbi:uncharacterized protein KIAA1958 homolog [Tubulanus polymorphus]|uniref:uncharacterized protein KIAA1958 homolog n=1 Tax=Tubulanus polymorphus TaxID=672921 RepID=UPI003DA1DDBD